MGKPRGWTPTLRYSPVNGMIVDWGIKGAPFALCGLPSKATTGASPVGPQEQCTDGEAIAEAVPTYDWYRWVPETIVGLRDANEDMAASYVRRAAIMFATGARVLRRQVAVTLQPGATRYHIDTFEGERAVGLASVSCAQGPCQSEGQITGVFVGDAKVDQARQEIVILPTAAQRPAHLLFTVWATPTEDSCLHDAFLYEKYRAQITLGARGMLMAEAHAHGAYLTNRGVASSRGDALMFNRADRAEAQFNQAIRRALVDVETEGMPNENPVSLWDTASNRGYRR